MGEIHLWNNPKMVCWWSIPLTTKVYGNVLVYAGVRDISLLIIVNFNTGYSYS